MTFFEKIKQEKPEFVENEEVLGCPGHHWDVPFLLSTKECVAQKNCSSCWNQEFHEGEVQDGSIR